MNKNNKVPEEFIPLFPGLIAFIIVFSCVGGMFLHIFAFRPDDLLCYRGFWVAIDGGADAQIYTWHDLNGNGLVDAGEPPFPGVEIQFPYDEDPYTDENGRIDTMEFKAGCTCKCWEGSYVEVIPPEGYLPTTPIRQDLTGQSVFYSFGFIAAPPDF